MNGTPPFLPTTSQISRISFCPFGFFTKSEPLSSFAPNLNFLSTSKIASIALDLCSCAMNHPPSAKKGCIGSRNLLPVLPVSSQNKVWVDLRVIRGCFGSLRLLIANQYNHFPIFPSASSVTP